MRRGADKRLFQDGKCFKNIPMARESAGKCYFCGENVLVSEGQEILYKRIQTGENIEDIPTHKSCRRKERKAQRKRY